MAMNTRLVDNTSIVNAIQTKDWTGAAATGDMVNMKDYNHLTIIIKVDAFAAGTPAVTLNQATDVANTGGKALGFSKQWTNRANTSSAILTEVAVTSNTFNLNTANSLYVIEVDAATLDVTNNFDCCNVLIGTPGSNTDLYGAIYVLSQPRFPQAQGITDPIN